jgi:hypothetical protein
MNKGMRREIKTHHQLIELKYLSNACVVLSSSDQAWPDFAVAT